MSNDVEFVHAMWDGMKSYIPKKERAMAAETFVKILDEHGMADGLEDELELDRQLLTAINLHFGIDEGEDEDEYDD